MKNREILFRGKANGLGEWLFGQLVYSHEGVHLVVDSYFKPSNGDKPEVWKVDPETVGQFTGLMDKNGTKIFEGDILTNNSQNDIIAGFYNGCFINNNTYITLHTEMYDPISRKVVFEITSNIHDNPTT